MNLRNLEKKYMARKEEPLSYIKKAGEKERISKQEFEKRITEIAKCKRDIKYFASHYFRIVTLDTGLSIIKLYPKQEELLNFFVEEKRCVVLASRQTGKTTTYTIYALWTLIFQPEKKIMLLANKADTMLEIIDRIRLAYGYLPAWMKPGVVTWNKGEIVFSNKSAIKGFSTSSDSARGYSASTVILDEAAFVPNNIASKVFESIYPVISSSKKSHFIMVSTPNGADPNNLYYNIWQQANSKADVKNTEGWKPFRFDWWDVPGRDEQWKNTTVASIGEKRFAQEFGNEFLAGQGSKKLIPDEMIEKLRVKLSEYKRSGIEPRECRLMSENEDKLFKFKMWHAFDSRRAYLASGDISEGVGGDESVLYIWDVADLGNITLCAMFASNSVSLVEFAFVCSKMLKLYGDPPLFAERNGVSAGMLDALRITYGYQNIAVENKKNEPGVYSHMTVKTAAELWAREMLTTDGFGFTIYDKDLIDEMGTFVKKDNKGVHTVYAAVRGAHDDHMMSFIWACYALHQDRIDNYFVVCGNFTSVLGQTYPKLLQPASAYTNELLNRIMSDPIYSDFMQFSRKNAEQSKALENKFKAEDKRDVFKYSQDDMYFDGDPWDGDCWNGKTGGNWNANNHMPVYFV